MVFYYKYEQVMDLKILLMHKYTLLNYFKIISIWYASLQLCRRRPNVQGKTGEGFQTTQYQTQDPQEIVPGQSQGFRWLIQAEIQLCFLILHQDSHMHLGLVKIPATLNSQKSQYC